MDRILFDEIYDVVVVGAGHAGCEAALAAARLGLKTIMFTVSTESIALMPCNPNIGGTSKGHLVREIDALGGEMGKNIDKSFIQSKMLNTAKGPAVHSLRAQADKSEYTREMRKTVENTDNLYIKQDEIVEIFTEENKVTGVKTFAQRLYSCKAVILCTGVYLGARCIYGETIRETGPNGLLSAKYLTDALLKLGIRMRRFKTGTPARIDKRSLDFSQMEEQFGDEKLIPFSFTNDGEQLQKNQESCWLAYTNETTHEIIKKNIDRSPLFSGEIKGTGPRYCPSIEDKVMRFTDKERHQLFIEPEGLYTNDMYIAGMSSSLPEDVQIQMYRSIKGFENAHITKCAYAIEYDCIDATQLKHTLEFKDISGLFSAGQFNGSSGYEEAAAQGIIAGINAERVIRGKTPFTLDRSEAYIGVLIDDLVTKETFEPYRMMTSRAEYRLLLRQDNADMRLTEKGYEIGLISKDRYTIFTRKKKLIDDELERLRRVTVTNSKFANSLLVELGSTELSNTVTLEELIRRPELNYIKVNSFARLVSEQHPEGISYNDYSEVEGRLFQTDIDSDISDQIDILIKFDGYIKRQIIQVEKYKRMERKVIPSDIDYDDVKSLRIEARQKLIKVRPYSIGQASRISGVSPADISVLLVYLEQKRLEGRKNL